MSTQANGPFQLPALPWEQAALEPVISSRTIGLHYGKHHRTYVTKLNELVAGTPMADMPLEQIVRETADKSDQKKIFNNAAQTWNHTFFWNCLRAPGRSQPSGKLLQRIESELGGLDKFRQQFAQAAIDCFGSGWAWLVDRNGKLEITATFNAMTPIAQGANPLLTIDVWEHAYYIDYENRRPEFVNAVVERLLNWDFAQQCLDKVGSGQRKAA